MVMGLGVMYSIMFIILESWSLLTILLMFPGSFWSIAWTIWFRMACYSASWLSYSGDSKLLMELS